MTRPAVVLLSGGIDSTTVLADVLNNGHTAHALTVDYRQRHRTEVAAAADIVNRLGAASHRVVSIDSAFTGATGPLTNPNQPIPERPLAEAATDPAPVTYVPARNTVLLALALALAETVDANCIYIGATAEDQTGYPDCRPDYFTAWSQMASLGIQRGPITAHAPLAAMTKADVIAHGLKLGVDYTPTWTCYNPTLRPGRRPKPCRACDACALRAAAFAANNIPDPGQVQR